ncbi:MAG: CDP-glycerol glycerophosphotransferase family protein, partial [Eubacterium sp.]|nr:CDP-glycerol glycerophosphotransferase family protein [Eubacterium sp.]
FKLKKTENKITFISRQSNTPSLDFSFLINEIKENYPQYKVDVLCKMIPNGFFGKILYGFEMLRQMKSLAASKVAVIDGYCIPVCMLKHKSDLTVIQIWHALGAIKKFGWQSVGTKDGRGTAVSRAMRMHRNYDYVLAPSKKTAEFYAEGFDIAKDKIRILSMPRVDFILDGKAKKEEFYALNPQMRDKKMVLYLPTFRSGEADAVDLLKAEFENINGYQLVISTHPLSDVKRDERFIVNGSFTSYDLMKLADVIITDYSASAFEASLLLKPLYFFVPDYALYMKDRGINVDIKKEFPSACFEQAEQLAKAIEKNDYDMHSLVQFKEKYVEHAETNNTEILTEFILNQTR